MSNDGVAGQLPTYQLRSGLTAVPQTPTESSWVKLRCADAQRMRTPEDGGARQPPWAAARPRARACPAPRHALRYEYELQDRIECSFFVPFA